MNEQEKQVFNDLRYSVEKIIDVVFEILAAHEERIDLLLEYINQDR